MYFLPGEAGKSEMPSAAPKELTHIKGCGGGRAESLGDARRVTARSDSAYSGEIIYKESIILSWTGVVYICCAFPSCHSRKKML